MPSNELLNNEVYIRASWLESMMNQSLLQEMNADKEKRNKEDQKMMRQGGSYVTFEDSSQGNVDIDAQPILPAQMMIRPQQEGKESQTRRNVYINHNYRGAQLSPMHKIAKLTKTERRQGRSSGFSKGLDLALRTSVEGSTAQMDAGAQQEPAVSVTPASYASNQDMGKLSRREVTYGMRPKYLRYNVWEARDREEEDTHVESLQCLVDWTERARPLPSVPITELLNATVMQTINNRPDLFKVVTPINIDRFETLLVSHPNRPFVESVCRGLREGFWPWANTHHGEYPSTVDGDREATLYRIIRYIERIHCTE
jgi:hypothetical protein